MKKPNLAVYMMLLILLCVGCTTSGETTDKDWSVSKHSDITGLYYGETASGYKAALLEIEKVSDDKVKSWLAENAGTDGYCILLISDADSWDAYIYCPVGQSDGYENLRFYVEDQSVELYVDSAEQGQGYLLALVQAPLRGPWPTAVNLYINQSAVPYSGMTGYDFLGAQ